MNRRLVIRSGLACAGLCLAAWRLPPMLDGALSSLDQHQGAISMLRGGGHTIHAPTNAGADADTHPAEQVEILGAARTLSPTERARLLEAARRHDPLAQARAKTAARAPVRATSAPGPAPAATPTAPTLDPSLAAAMRALGLDPAAADLSTLDVEALLNGARGQRPRD